MDCFTPQQTMELISRIGQKKSKMRIDKLFWNSFMAGPLLGFGCAISLSTNSSPWYQENAPGLIRTIAACFFPIGLIVVVLTGADLYTSNVMFLPVAFLHRRCTVTDVAKSWVVSFFGNLAGMLFFCLIICGYGGIFSSGAYKAESITFAIAKAVTPKWHQIFLKAIGANWLVCLAVFMSTSSREIVSKIVAIWWPIMCFVGLGMDHVIANMFLVPIGIFNGAPFGVGYYIWKSMIPALIGNTIGGGLFVGVIYWYLYMVSPPVTDVICMIQADLSALFQTGDEAVAADFDRSEGMLHGAETTVNENAGPIHNPDSYTNGNGYAHKTV